MKQFSLILFSLFVSTIFFQSVGAETLRIPSSCDPNSALNQVDESYRHDFIRNWKNRTCAHYERACAENPPVGDPVALEGKMKAQRCPGLKKECNALKAEAKRISLEACVPIEKEHSAEFSNSSKNQISDKAEYLKFLKKIRHSISCGKDVFWVYGPHNILHDYFSSLRNRFKTISVDPKVGAEMDKVECIYRISRNYKPNECSGIKSDCISIKASEYLAPKIEKKGRSEKPAQK